MKISLSQRAGGIVQWQNSFLAYKRRYKDRKEKQINGGGGKVMHREQVISQNL